MPTTAIAGLQGWEREDWIARSDEGLPAFLVKCRAAHAAALDEYLKAVAGVVNTSAQIEADARQHRRAVRDAVAEGRTPPTREFDSDVGDAQREVAAEDAEHSRRELAEVACEVLAEIRQHRDEFDEVLYLGASPELRMALGGFNEHERLRQERLKNVRSEELIIDIDDPANRELTTLGEQGASHAAAA